MTDAAPRRMAARAEQRRQGEVLYRPAGMPLNPTKSEDGCGAGIAAGLKYAFS